MPSTEYKNISMTFVWAQLVKVHKYRDELDSLWMHTSFIFSSLRNLSDADAAACGDHHSLFELFLSHLRSVSRRRAVHMCIVLSVKNSCRAVGEFGNRPTALNW